MTTKHARYSPLLLLILLLALLITTSGASWPEPSQAHPFQVSEKPVAVGIGFECFSIQFKASFQRPIQSEIMTTGSNIQTALKWLARRGYQTLRFKNIPDWTALQEGTKTASVFAYFGHGNQKSLVFVDGGCGNNVKLDESWLDKTSPQNLKLVLLVACETAKDYETAETLLEAFVDKYGAQKALGFSGTVNTLAAQSWHDSFWTYALDPENKTEVSDAAARAYNDKLRSNPLVGWGLTGLESLVILGDEQVYLTEGVTGGSSGIDIIEEIKKWLESIPRAIEQKLSELRRFFEKELRQLLEKWLAQIQTELEQMLRDLLNQFLRELQEVCAGSISMGMIVIAFAYGRRKKSERP